MAIGTRLALAALLLGAASPSVLLAQDAAESAATGTAAAGDAAAAPEAAGADAASGADAAAEGTATPGAGAAEPDGAPQAGAALPTSAADAATGGFYVDSTEGDWTIRCQKTDGGTDPCEIYQLMKDGNGNSVAEISMIPIEGKAAAGATFVAPLETDLIAGVGLQVDGGKQQVYPFGFCAPVGCVSRIGFTDAEVDVLKKGNKATVQLQPYGAGPDHKVDLALSLSGFTAAWNTLKARPVAPAPDADAAPAAAADAPAKAE